MKRWMLPRLGLLLAMAVLVGVGASRVRIDNSPGEWLDPSDPDVAQWRERVERFGSDEAVIFIGTGEQLADAFDTVSWRQQLELTARLLSDERIEEVWSLPRLVRAVLGNAGDDPPAPGVREVIRAAPVLRGFLLHADGNGPVIVATVNDADSAARERLVADMESMAADSGGWTIVGPTWFNVAIDQLARRESAAVAALMTILLAIGGWLLIGGWRGSALLVLSAGVPLTVWAAVVGWRGQPLSAVEMTALPMLGVVGMENALHAIGALRALGGGRATASLPPGEKRALLLANLTTTASLAGLAMMPLPMISELGITLPPAVIASLLFTLYAIPRMSPRIMGELVVRDNERGSEADGDTGRGRRASVLLYRLGDSLARLGLRCRRSALALAIGVPLLGLLAVPALTTEANISRRLVPSSPSAERIAAAESALGGSLTATVVLRAHEDGSVVARMTELLRARPDITSVANQAEFSSLAFAMIAASPEPWRALDVGTRLGGIDPRQLRTLPADELRLLIPDAPSVQLQALYREIREHQEVDAVIGTVPLLIEAQSSILGDLLTGAATSFFLVILVLMIGAPRSPILWIVLPLNVAPIALIVLLAAMLRWPIDLLSVQLGSLLFGYIVNSTIYVGSTALATDRTPGAVRGAAASAAPAVLGAAILSGLSFATPLMSQLISLREAAMLSCAALIYAAFCDLAILPALLARAPAPSAD